MNDLYYARYDYRDTKSWFDEGSGDNLANGECSGILVTENHAYYDLIGGRIVNEEEIRDIKPLSKVIDLSILESDTLTLQEITQLKREIDEKSNYKPFEEFTDSGSFVEGQHPSFGTR